MLHAQEGDPEEFGKKNVHVDNDTLIVNQQDPETEVEETGNLTPVKEGKTTNGLSPASGSLNSQKSKKSGTTKSESKVKETKSKYNILLYYFYKSKHEETDSKESSSAN